MSNFLRRTPLSRWYFNLWFDLLNFGVFYLISHHLNILHVTYNEVNILQSVVSDKRLNNHSCNKWIIGSGHFDFRVVWNCVSQNFDFFWLIIFFLMFLDVFDVLMSKIIYKKWKKYYFDAFPSKKHFEKQPLPLSNISFTR